VADGAAMAEALLDGAFTKSLRIVFTTNVRAPAPTQPVARLPPRVIYQVPRSHASHYIQPAPLTKHAGCAGGGLGAGGRRQVRAKEQNEVFGGRQPLTRVSQHVGGGTSFYLARSRVAPRPRSPPHASIPTRAASVSLPPLDI
jgi:hypothetical protein